MQMFRTLFIAVLGLSCLAAQAQWQWVDNAGRKVFSDQPPPLNIPAKNILKQPGKAANVANLPAAPASGVAAVGTAAAPLPSADDKELLAKKKKAEAEALARAKDESDSAVKIKAANCERAKANQAALESGVRMAVTNAKGEREMLDDTGRKAEMQRTRAAIQSNCK